jgi:glucose/arabinose dehydrogenase
MTRRLAPGPLLAVLLGTLGLAAQAQQYPVGWGPNPALPEPQHTLIPTLNEAKADPWPQGTHPTPAAGLAATAYGTGLDHPRWLYVLPNGDVLVAETNKPEDAPKETGIKAKVAGMVQKKAGAGVPSPDRITLLRGLDANGAAASKTVFLQGLHSPFGMALVGSNLYVANADALWRFPYKAGATSIEAAGAKVLDLPAGINHHWTKNVIASPDGKKLYITVGSNSNVGENGMEIELGRAAIWEYDIASGKSRIYASGLRNPQGMSFEPHTKALWVSVNERDELGNDLVPDYMTAVKDGAFYGWPYSYYGQHVDTRVKPQQPDMVAKAVAPDYGLGAHTASLGMSFYDASLLPQYKGGALVSQHGSWNRKPRAGYELVFVPFANGKPSGPPQEVLKGFLSEDGRAYGRPVGVAVDKSGAILLADDVGNRVWRIAPASK